MKKLLAIVLLFCMIFACSCSSSKGKGDTTTGDPTVSTSEAPADSSSEDTVDSSSETPDAPTEFSRGTVEGNVYDNAYADITFTKSDAWTYLTDAELAQLIGIALEQLNAKNPFDGVSSLFDMMAVDTQTNSNVSVSFEKTTVTESAYLDLVKSQLSSRGYVFGDKTEATLGGVDYTKMTATVTSNGVTMSQGLYVRSVDGLMCIVTITVVGEGDLATYEAMFS